MSTGKEYTKAFNNGYILAEYDPKLLNEISKTLGPTNIYIEGFLDGKKQFEVENSRSQLSELDKLRIQSLDRGTDFSIEV